MPQLDFKTFDSLAFRWESTQMLWFILVEEDGFPLLHFRAGRNEESEWKFQSMTKTERKSREMGKASHKACFNITDVICAPSIKCIVAAHSFIKAFERDQKDEMKILNIKVDGGLSESIEGYYLQKPFRSLAAERGYPVDEVYETSVKWSRNSIVDPYVNLDWRIKAALESFREKYSGSMDKVVAVFVDKSLESVLRGVGIRSRVLFKLHAPPVDDDTPMPQLDFKTFDSLAFRWESTQMLWFILVEEDGFPLLHFRAGRNEESEWKFQSMTKTERKSREMGKASHKACFNITDVICAPSIKCIVAAHSFIKAFERDQKDEMKILNIKVDGGLSESIEGYYLQKQFRSLAAERGYPVDEVYEFRQFCTSMSQSYFRTFDSWAFSWQSTQTLWFILVEEDRFPHLRFRAVRNEMGEWKFQSVTTIENKSRVMGKASHEACFNITDVICAPSMRCVAAADSFIKAFEGDQKDETKILNIKVDGGLSESVEGYYLVKQFRSLAVERGYPVDEVYETSIKWSENCNLDTYVNFDCRINAALESLREKYSGSMDKMVAVFVDSSLESVLRGVGLRSQVVFKLHAPAVEDTPMARKNEGN
ncbi:hypothetical protein T11_7969 [Trichinella zimbabwensis]|uniref:Uncharacterized protein n=1 Tax=Trichinella zimbabwensis TaxID=268475 RepID=A0A0V1HTG8_9BILA|nr:hypothetical protein T11_7969 [Trichinella zimbabwensis]